MECKYKCAFGKISSECHRLNWRFLTQKEICYTYRHPDIKSEGLKIFFSCSGLFNLAELLMKMRLDIHSEIAQNDEMRACKLLKKDQTKPIIFVIFIILLRLKKNFFIWSSWITYFHVLHSPFLWSAVESQISV